LLRLLEAKRYQQPVEGLTLQGQRCQTDCSRYVPQQPRRSGPASDRIWLRQQQQTKNTIEYSINYTTIDSYYNSKSVMALSLNITHNSFNDIRNFCRNFLYLGIHTVNSRGFKCSLTSSKRSFYRAANAVFVKIGGRSSEDVILQLIRSKYMSALLYGLEACPLRSSDNNSLDFVINRFFVKLFKTNNLGKKHLLIAVCSLTLTCPVLS